MAFGRQSATDRPFDPGGKLRGARLVLGPAMLLSERPLSMRAALDPALEALVAMHTALAWRSAWYGRSSPIGKVRKVFITLNRIEFQEVGGSPYRLVARHNIA